MSDNGNIIILGDKDDVITKDNNVKNETFKKSRKTSDTVQRYLAQEKLEKEKRKSEK